MIKRTFGKICAIMLVLLLAIIILAACGKDKYKVDFLVDGEIYCSLKSGENEFKLPDAPEKDGYVFDGWYLDEDSWKKPFTQKTLTQGALSGNVSVYARWKAPDELSGTQIELDGFSQDGDNVYNIKVSNTTKSLEIEPLLSLDERSSWVLSTDPRGRSVIKSKTASLAVGNNIYYALVTDVSGETQVYTFKIRRKPTYNVIFDVAGGKSLEIQTVEEDGLATEPVTTRDGYDFLGWDHDFSAPITENKVITASWRAKEYTVAYDAAGGSVDGSSFNILYGKKYTLATPTRENYEFLGWYYGDKRVDDLTWSVPANATLVARWDPCKYEISYDLKGGSVATPNPTVYTVESEDITLINPTRTGYIFLGWTGTGISEPATSVTLPSGSVGAREYSANWECEDYEIVYHLNGGDNAIGNPNGYNIESESISLIAPTRTGYSFAGWYKSEDLAEDSKISVIPTGTSGDLNLYAKWTANEYTVTFKNQGGSGASSVTVEYGSSLPYVSKPTKTGYTFLGYYDSVTGGVQYYNADMDSMLTWSRTEGITLYARWEANEYTVSFSANGGSGAQGSVLATYGEAMPSATAPTRTGYTFMGYYTAVNGGVNYYNADMTSARVCDLTEDTVLYAYWSANEYTVTFDNQGGSGESSVTVEYGSSLPYVSKPTKAGYTFLGYYDSATGGAQYYDADMSSMLTWSRTEGITLYARWEANEYTVSFSANGGSGAQGSVLATYGEAMPSATTAPTRTGYTFMGYYTDVNGEGVKYYNADMTGARDCDLTEDTVLYAHWQGVSYSVSFNANGGSGTMSSQIFEYGVSESLNANSFTRTGYSFAGWNTEANGNGISYSDNEAVSNLTSVSEGSVTLYAQWVAKTVTVALYDIRNTNPTYTVSFDLNGASGAAPAPQTVTKETGLSYPAVPVRSGYVFAGWYADSSCSGSMYDFTADITGNITLYAKWVEMSTTTHTREYFDVMNYTSSSSKKSVTADSYSDYNYYYFTCYTSGSYKIYVNWIEGDFNFQVNNVTANTQISINNLFNGNKSCTVSFTANAGDVIRIGVIRYSSYYNMISNGEFYVTGASYPNDGGLADGEIIVTDELTYGQSFTLEIPTKEGYRFLGWYDGVDGSGTQYTNENGESIGVWDKDADATLYAKWELI